MKTSVISLSIVLIVLIFSCAKEESVDEFVLNLPEEVYDYESTQEDPFNGSWFDNNPMGNEVSDHGATLGRVLFYDKRLSVSNKTACASCHVQSKGFADGLAVSEGFFVEQTRRNSPGIVNLRNKENFFLDGRVSILEEQVLMPIADHIEMGFSDIPELIEKMSILDYYPELFSNAFGDNAVTGERVSLALAQFLSSMTSFETKFDIGRNNGFADFTELEMHGKNLFDHALPCGNCHFGNDLGGWNTANIGLDMAYEDNGVSEWSGNTFNEGQFKVPALRNIALTAPYMHDGRFETLEEVIQHYASGVVQHNNLSSTLRTGGGWDADPSFSENTIVSSSGFGSPIQFSLSSNDVNALVAFLETLTDTDLAQDVRFSDPFQ